MPLRYLDVTYACYDNYLVTLWNIYDCRVGYRVMSSPIPSIVISSDLEPKETIPSTLVHSPISRHAAISDEESEPTEESSEDFAIVPVIDPAPGDH